VSWRVATAAASQRKKKKANQRSTTRPESSSDHIAAFLSPRVVESVTGLCLAARHAWRCLAPQMLTALSRESSGNDFRHPGTYLLLLLAPYLVSIKLK